MAERQPGDIDAYAGHRWHKWDEWFDGTVWRFELGVDFRTQKSFRSMAYTEATHRALRIRTHWDNRRYLYLQAFRIDGSPVEPAP
jgi:hypothetical protein